MSKKLTFTITAIILALLVPISTLMISKLQADNTAANVSATRTVELENAAIDYESILNEFENSTLKTEGSLTTFEGYKPIDASILSEFDNLSSLEAEQVQDTYVKYNFSYDKETNIVTLSAETKNENGEIEIEEISGVGFINDQNQIDAVMNIDGESILLSEMQESGMIENCGWFKRLIKKVVKKVVKVTVAAAVVVTGVALVVATAAVTAPALMAAGVGIVTSTGIGAAAGLAAGALYAATVGAAAIQAGTAISEPIAEGISSIVDKASGAILEILYKGVAYKSAILTATIASTLAKDAYFMARATNNGNMEYYPIAIPRHTAVSIMAANTDVSIYTYYDKNARSIAQEAGNNESPIWERHHEFGYFDHYHLGNLTNRYERHDICKSHAFYGLPQFN